MAELHEGHRSRLRARFLQSGLDGFHDINTLELILFYAHTRKDTNPLAHRLLDRFGSLAGVLEAPVEELMKVDGVGETTAVLLHLFPQVARKVQISRSEEILVLDTTTKAGTYLLPRFSGERDEVVYLLCMDANCRPLDCRLLFRGGFDSASVSVRKIVETALAVNASSVILAHNHPGGTAQPSQEDASATLALQQALKTLDILLADHIIVAGDTFVSMADCGFFDSEELPENF